MYIQKNAGGDVSDIIKFLMETVNEEYAIGVKDGKIVEAGEYQDAYGFSSVALKMSKRYTGSQINQKTTQQLEKRVEKVIVFVASRCTTCRFKTKISRKGY